MGLLFRILFPSSSDETGEKKYDMLDYQNEDDFYESNTDDFDSYEDAVEYYFDHGGR